MFNHTLFAFVIFFAHSTIAQLSGVYSVGGLNDDFPLMSQVINALENQGMTSTVVLDIAPGHYSEFHLESVAAPPGEKLILRPRNDFEDSVTFQKVHLKFCERIQFYKINVVMPDPSHEESLVNLDRSDSILLRRCRIADSVSLNSVWDDHPPLTINVGTTGNSSGYKNIYIDSCFIFSNEHLLPYSASRTTVDLHGTLGFVHFTNDTIYGSYDFNNSDEREFVNCEFYLVKDLWSNGNKRIDSCNFHCIPWFNDSTVSIHDILGDSIRGCRILGATNLDIKGRVLSNNFIDSDETYTNGGGNTININNYYTGDLYFDIMSPPSSNYNAIFKNNVVAGDTDISCLSGYCWIVNNSFLGNVNADSFYGRFIYFYHNNFQSNKLFYHRAYGEVINNNLGDVYFAKAGRPELLLANNNYNTQDTSSVYYSFFDISPYYFDPSYEGMTDLHVSNPSIYSIAQYDIEPLFSYDMDDEFRDTIRTIGADEVCLSLPLPDTIAVTCGTTYTIALCDSLANHYSWTPVSCFIDSTTSHPEIFVDTIRKVYLIDLNGSTIDSIVFIPELIDSRKEYLFGWCNINSQLRTYNHPNSQINWSPGHLFSDSTIYNPTAVLDTTTWLIATQHIPNCGSRYDSIRFYINSDPNADIIFDSVDCLGWKLRISNTCYDSIRWNLSDGTEYSDTLGFWHYFIDSGSYDVVLTIWSDGQSSSDTLTYYAGCAGIENYLKDENYLKVFPNPADTEIHIEINPGLLGKIVTLVDAMGSIVKRIRLNESYNMFDISNLSPGLYYLKVDRFNRKLIVR